MKNYKTSVVIPVYNQEKNIRKCIYTLKLQTIGLQNMEIILVDDGSADQSDVICQKFANKYQNIIYIKQQNQGVSAARNAGLKIATGKYVFFLDADDQLEKHTIEKVTAFFDAVYDEVDLVTYPIETIYNGKKLPGHFRYQYLKESGIYDLNKEPYIGQTTMNIVVKNKFRNNILFDENQTFSEDQRYCCEVLKEKLKMGFCSEGVYIYYRDNNSSSGRLSGSCYIFEQCMEFFEQLFEGYEDVPMTFQGLYVNDIYWKMLTNIFFPYHYSAEEFEKALQRIKTLLQKCANHVILEHPNIDFFEKYYLLRLKGEDTISCYVDADSFCLCNQGNIVVRETSMEIVITKLRVSGEVVEIDGFIKSAFLQFYDKEVMVCAVENDGRLTRKLQLEESAHNYYLSHEKTQRFQAFRYRGSIDEVQKVRFEVMLEGRWFLTKYYFMPLVSLSHQRGIYTCQKGDIKIAVDSKNNFLFSRINELKKIKEIWLYYDCVGVQRDNGYLQFEHDIQIDDHVDRYYIVTDQKQATNKKYKKYFVKFGSIKHKALLKQCNKIITAYIEESNIFPYEMKAYDKYSRDFAFEVIYLQHGVLHAVMPWKYSREKMLADKIVISTEEEAKLFIQNGYKEDELIKTGMPRFEFLEMNSNPQNKILFAPSWRQYLVGDYRNHRWQPLEKKFLESKFFLYFNELLNSRELEQLLEDKGYFLEVKLHPIFNVYSKFFRFKSDRISFADGTTEDNEYALFLTDFSSYAYNFEYLNIPVVHFVPDVDEFRAGMNGYRELNYSPEFWINMPKNTIEVVDKMRKILDGESVKKYAEFYPMGKNIRGQIYQSIKQDDQKN